MRVAASALLPIWLTGCAACNDSPPAMIVPPVPAGLSACTAEAVPPIPGAPGSPLRRSDAAAALAEQRASALAKARCANDWFVFYTDLYQLVAR